MHPTPTLPLVRAAYHQTLQLLSRLRSLDTDSKEDNDLHSSTALVIPFNDIFTYTSVLYKGSGLLFVPPGSRPPG